jgi:hypothetical protein
MNADYLNTVRLLLKVAPVALGSEVFALKGGTAINLFVRDLPRLALPLLASEELYGSKLVAAMDRQHPRDLFDVLGLYESVGLSVAVVECFVCYLAGHNRPVHEVLFASEVDLESAYENEFQGMTSAPVALSDLIKVRRRLFEDLPRALTSSHRNFLMSLIQAEPKWELMSCSHLRELPALKWKMLNLERLRSSNSGKFEQQANELEARFEIL